MAKKPMTKAQIVTHFAGEFDLSKKIASAVIDGMASLAISETKKTGSFTLPGIGTNWFFRNGRPGQGGIHKPVKQSRFQQKRW